LAQGLEAQVDLGLVFSLAPVPESLP